IVMKQPRLKGAIDKLMPLSAVVGVAAIVFAVIQLVRWAGRFDAMTSTIPGLAMLATIVLGATLGVLFNLPFFGDQVQQRAARLARLRRDPCDRERHGMVAELARELRERVCDRVQRVVAVARRVHLVVDDAPARRPLVRAVLAAEQAAAGRAVRDHREPERAR